MKFTTILALWLGIWLFYPAMGKAQYYSPRSRQMETYQDLPEVIVRGFQPSKAQDLTYLKYVSADTFTVKILFFPFLQNRDTLLVQEYIFYAGSQQLSVPVVQLDEGWYQAHFFCNNRKVGICWLQIYR